MYTGAWCNTTHTACSGARTRTHGQYVRIQCNRTRNSCYVCTVDGLTRNINSKIISCQQGDRKTQSNMTMWTSWGDVREQINIQTGTRAETGDTSTMRQLRQWADEKLFRAMYLWLSISLKIFVLNWNAIKYYIRDLVSETKTQTRGVRWHCSRARDVQ